MSNPTNQQIIDVLRKAIDKAGVPHDFRTNLIGYFCNGWNELVQTTASVDMESAAKAVYETFEGADQYPWIPGGNSFKQDEARRYVRIALESVRNSEPTNIRERWNIERDGDALLVCFNDHEKSQGCIYERFVPETLQTSTAVAVRYDFDGFGWQYIDNGSGSDWMTRHPDGELLYDRPAPMDKLPE